MATQPESHNEDLDRTDELPRLDVAAYEASLAKAAGEGLSRTDAWEVEALQDLDEIARSESQPASPPPLSTERKAGVRNDPQINVARIMQRMAQLEADIAEAYDANAALQKRNQAIQEAREEQIARIRALEADNERLSEHRTLATGMQERFEHQLREQSLQLDTQLKEIQSARFAERLRADQEREEFRHQSAAMGAQITALQQDNRRLQEQSQASIALANRHEAALSALESSLGGQKAGAAQLARQLAAKLTDYETLSSMVEVRNRNINELTRARDDLQQRLDRETASGVELSSRLEATALNLSRLDAAHSESSNALAQRLEEIGALRNSLQAAEDAAAKAQRELAAAAVTAADQEKRRKELEERLDASGQRIDELTGERASALDQVRALSGERDGLLPLSAQLVARSQELERSDAEVARLQAELTELRADVASQSEEALEREAEFKELQQSATQLRYSRDSLQEALEDAQQTISQLRDDDQARTQLLTERTEELAGLHTRFSEHGLAMRGLEHAIRSRDELLDKLRGQLQTAQDERSIMADQLDKARARAKSMAQQIFQRDNQIASLRADLAARAEALAAIRRDVDRIEADVEVDADSSDHLGQVLEPVGHDGYPIFLNAKLITVGRTSENDVCIPSKLISRHHARLMVAANGVVTVEDAGSTNGCYVNGQQVHSHTLQEGDVLELGDLRYRMYNRSENGTRIRANVVSISDGRRGPD